MARVAVLGSTGSIGTQTLDIVRQSPDRHEVVAIGAARSVESLALQAKEFRPQVVAIADAALASALRADIAINGVVGFAGLSVTMATLEAGKRLGLANKESLIAAGPVVQKVR